ncbi:MAG: TM0106 family RecB-like putative nuclease [Deltaproteobacteria bacterium]|nr:MAG: TM0106 family RecB-like putative nuclease [Deltaproteobacteria bacterium]
MQVLNGQFLFSPSDLANFVACEHLTQLEIAVARGEITRPNFGNAYVDLIVRKGLEHERDFLDSIRAAGHMVKEIGLGQDRDFAAAAEATAAAMRDGSEYIYQAVFASDGWHGIADFLERIDRPSALDGWSYQVLDTKLARHPRPEHALQLCFYSRALGQIQKFEPEVAYVVLGTRNRFPIRLANVSAYFRRLQRRFRDTITIRGQTAPYPCEHCPLCGFLSTCEARWESEDHLVRVAGIRRDQVSRLTAAGISTLTVLAEARPNTRIPKIPASTFDGLHDQAVLQLETEHCDKIAWHKLPVEEGRGFAFLRQRSKGDIILDLEGHPFFEPARGLTFLFGVVTVDGDAPRYEALWAHDRDGECRAFEAFIDLVHGRLADYPDLHVYHFGAYEESAIKRLMGEYATRESEVDDLLRRKIFVNLYTVFRQALRAGVPSYSLKKLEPLFEFTRAASVRSGMEAILDYEQWLQTKDSKFLEQIAAYNEEDCQATYGLLKWLHSLRPAELTWPQPLTVRTVSEDAAEAGNARQLLRDQLLESAEAGSARWLAAELLEYHRREARPAWWWYFEQLGMSPEELVDDSESIGCLEPDPLVPPEGRKKSLVHTLRFPAQDHKLGPGRVYDPATGENAGEILEINDATGMLKLLRGPKLTAVPLPRSLISGGPFDDSQQRNAVFRFAESIQRGEARYPALEAILKRDCPRVQGIAAGERIQTTDLAEMKALSLRLDESYLFVQGPPGTGKTWTDARLIAHLLANGKRVGVTAQSHKAIHNLLRELEDVAREDDVRFRGLKKSTKENPESEYESDFFKSESNNSRFFEMSRQAQVVAGTAWLFARSELDRQLDYLVIDEAGQVSLADALAVGTSTHNLILLGDPLQLAQVSQGVHPPGCGASVLEHLLGEAPTITEDRGIFLERSYRMHPDVCAFISEIVYAGRLRSDTLAVQRTTSFGTGIRFVPVEHEGNRSASDEEVAQIAAIITNMLEGSFTAEDGSTRPLCEKDFMVVAPYNAQVRRLRATLRKGVGVGTVDKFQGQQAPIVFFSMATSSGEDAPHNLAFLFSRNRLNVAISRAQCLAFLVCSPRLLEARCDSIEEMELVNALCRLAEYAESSPGLGS